uniref:Uncharacterized protein n=1 Tax=Arundo donax TaxID=35708 RepID=A0A0A9DRX4_ARUDO
MTTGKIQTSKIYKKLNLMCRVKFELLWKPWKNGAWILEYPSHNLSVSNFRLPTRATMLSDIAVNTLIVPHSKFKIPSHGEVGQIQATTVWTNCNATWGLRPMSPVKNSMSYQFQADSEDRLNTAPSVLGH